MAMWQFDLVKLESTDFTKWDAWVMSRPEGAVFYTTHWLRALSSKEPTVVAALGDYNRIIGGFAFVDEPAKAGFKRIIPPAYTPYFAPLAPADVEIQQGFIDELLSFLKPFDGLRWRPAYTDRQHLFAKDAVESVSAISMILERDSSTRNTYSKSLITHLKKAKKKGLYAYFDLKPKDVYPLVAQSMNHNGRKAPLSELAFVQAFDELQKLELVECIGVRSVEGQLIAAGIYPRDIYRYYNLVIGTPRQPEYPEAGAFLHQTAIQRAFDLGLIFDFEGSSIPGVKEFYQRFRAKEIPINRYSHAGSLKAKLSAPFLKSLGKNLY